MTDNPISDDQASEVDRLLAQRTNSISRTRKGRVWEVNIDGQPIAVSISADSLTLSSSLNSQTTYDVLKELSLSLAGLLDGVSSEPLK
jgi:hypothetical protein